MIYTLLLNQNGIVVSKAKNYMDKLVKNEIEITEQQYEQINEFPCIIAVENGKVVSWTKTKLPPMVEVPHLPSLEERVSAMEQALLEVL